MNKILVKEVFKEEFSSRFVRSVLFMIEEREITTSHFGINLINESITDEEKIRIMGELQFFEGLTSSCFYFSHNVVGCIPFSDIRRFENGKSELAGERLFYNQLKEKIPEYNQLIDILKDIDLKALINGVTRDEIIFEGTPKLISFMDKMASPISKVLQNKFNNVLREIENINNAN